MIEKIHSSHPSIFLAALLCLVTTSAWAVSPPNDDFAGCPSLRGVPLSVSGTNTDATLEPGEPLNIDVVDHSVWWRWIVPETGYYELVFDVDRFTPYCTLIRGNDFNAMNFFADNVQTSGPLSRVQFSAEQGEEIQILVMSINFNGGSKMTGEFQFTLTAIEPPEFSDWEYKDLNGNLVKSTDFAGQMVILNIWATWCGPCLNEIPHMIELQKLYQDEGFTFIGVSTGEEPIDVASFANTKIDFNYPVLINPSGEFLEPIPAIPTSYVISRENRLVEKIVGFRSLDQWKEIVARHFEPLPIVLSAERMNNKLRLQWKSSRTKTYQLQYQSGLGDGRWHDLGPGELVGDRMQAIVPLDEQYRFFRLVQDTL